MEKIKVKLIKRTKKAVFVKDENGNEAWIQNRSYKNDEVNKNIFDKGVKYISDREKEKKDNEKFLNSFIDISDYVENTTASGKAEYFNLTFFEEHTDQSIKKRIFIPLSLKKEGKYPAWLLMKKRKEISTDLPKNGYWTCETGPELFRGAY